METVELIIKISITLFNAFALGFALIIISRWHSRMENKLNSIQRYIHHVSDRNDIIYINQLEEIKRMLIESERYEEADRVRKCIENEYNNLEKRMKK